MVSDDIYDPYEIKFPFLQFLSLALCYPISPSVMPNTIFSYVHYKIYKLCLFLDNIFNGRQMCISTEF